MAQIDCFDIKQPLSVAFEDEYRDFGLNQEQKNEEPHLKMAIMAEIPLLSSTLYFRPFNIIFI